MKNGLALALLMMVICMQSIRRNTNKNRERRNDHVENEDLQLRTRQRASKRRILFVDGTQKRGKEPFAKSNWSASARYLLRMPLG